MINQNDPSLKMVHNRKITRNLLFTLPKNVKFINVFISPDFKRIAYIKKISQSLFSQSQFVAVIDSNEEENYKAISEIVYSPDSQHIAYVAHNGNKNLLILDGIIIIEANKIEKPVFSPDSQHLAAPVRMTDGWYIIFDGKLEKKYDLIDPRLIFSPNSKRYAYRAAKDKKQLVILDGEECAIHDSTGENSLVFSDDSKRFAYAARNNTNWSYIIDSKPGPQHQLLSPVTLTFNKDATQFAYATLSDDIGTVILDHKDCDSIYGNVNNIQFSPNSNNLYFSYGLPGGVWNIKMFHSGGDFPHGILKGISTESFSYHIDSLSISPDSKRIFSICFPLNVGSNLKKSIYILDGISKSGFLWKKCFHVSKGEIFNDILFIQGKQIFHTESNAFKYIAFKKSLKSIYIITEILE